MISIILDNDFIFSSLNDPIIVKNTINLLYIFISKEKAEHYQYEK